jgi:putative ABC transport system ATP-binding protein
MVTHDPVAAAHADRVVFLVDGRVAGELTGASARRIAATLADLETPGRESEAPESEGRARREAASC